MEAFGGSPGIHRGVVEGLLNEPEQVANPGNAMVAERRMAEEEANESVKAVLLISGADK